MPDEQRTANNSQTYVVGADSFLFEVLKQENGQATVIRFRLENPQYHAGDVVVVLSGSEIHFHGMMENSLRVGNRKRPSWLAASRYGPVTDLYPAELPHITRGKGDSYPGVEERTSMR